MNIENKNVVSTLYDSIKNIIEQSKHYAVTQVNYYLVIAYWNIGKMIKENIIETKRAEYGEETIKKLGEKLTLEYGNGFGQRNLFRMMKFYEFFHDKTILTTMSAKFSWSHFVEFIRIEDDLKRDFYITMCYNEKWSVRTLRERINTMLFERTAISKNPKKQSKTTLLYSQKKTK